MAALQDSALNQTTVKAPYPAYSCVNAVMA
jgi:hypothetical protein